MNDGPVVNGGAGVDEWLAVTRDAVIIASIPGDVVATHSVGSCVQRSSAATP